MLPTKFKPDFPVAQDEASKVLPWIIGFMIYLACLAAIAAINLNFYMGGKNYSFTSSLFVQIPGDIEEKEKVSQSILKYMLNRKEVSEVVIIPESRVRHLIEPWLGGGDVLSGLPLPVIIEAKLATDGKVNTAEILNDLIKLESRVELEDNANWMDRLNQFTRSVQMVAICVVVMIALATVGMVVMACRTGLKLHADSIGILHMVGATNEYIARQFQANSLNLIIRAGLLAIAMLIPTLIPLNMISSSMDWMELKVFDFSFAHFFLVVGIIAASCAIALFFSRRTVIGMLSEPS